MVYFPGFCFTAKRKKSYRNKKGRLERKRLFKSARIITENAEGRVQKVYELASPN